MPRPTTPSPLRRPLALLGAMLFSTATFGADPQGVFVGGSFNRIGAPRLALFDANTGAWRGPAIAAAGVRAVLIRGPHLYLGGDFTSIAGQPRSGLARLTLDGQLDPAWKPSVAGTVAALAADGDGLYLGGSFASVDGEPRMNLARVSLTDGTTGEWRADADGAVNVLAVAKGNLVVGGAFTVIGGESHVRIARIIAKTGIPATEFTAAADSDVRALVIKGEKIVVGGQFSRINAEDRLGLARLELASGDVDPEWRADVDGAVMSLACEFDLLHVGGAFATVASQPRQNCARLSWNDGKPDAWTADADEQVSAIVESDTGRVILAGRFTGIGGTSTPSIAAVSKASGAVDPVWLAQGSTGGSEVTGLALRGEVLAAACDLLDGPRRTAVARIGADGLPVDWGLAFDGSRIRVLCSVVHGGFRYIGGDFTLVSGQPRMNLVRIALKTGELDAKWRCDANGPVRSLAIAGDRLLVGGDFTTLGGQHRNHLGRVALIDAAVDPWSVAVDGSVHALLPIGAAVFVTGNFQHLGGLERRGFGRIADDGGADAGFSADLTDGGMPGSGAALALLPDGGIAIGGRFTAIGASAAGNLAAVDPTSGALRPWQADADGPVFALGSADGKLAVGGGFSTLGGQPRGRIGVIDAATGIPTAWRADADAEVWSLAITGDLLWLGGDFNLVAGQPSTRLARCRWIDGTPLPTTGADDRVETLAPESDASSAPNLR